MRSSAPMVAVSGCTSMGAGAAAPRCFVVVVGDGHGCLALVWDAEAVGQRLEVEDRGADAAAGLEVAVRLDGVVEGVALVDLDRDPAGADVVEELAGQLGPLGRVGDVVGQGRAGDEQRALDRQLHGVDRRDRAGRVPKQTSSPRRRSESSDDW